VKNETAALELARLLRDDELDAVTGGIVDGCIRLPTIVGPFVPPTSPGFVDQFASRLPSWVRPAPV
jgi:hypothetical protein